MKNFLKTNYHAHTYRCKHASGTEREYIEAAIEMGMKTFGFSDHIPCPFETAFVSRIRMTMDQADEYVATIKQLKKEYEKQIQILVGFEAEYIPDFYEKQMELVKRLECDYLILGQHFLESEETGPYTGSPTCDSKILRDYVDTVIAGMETGSYLYLCHPDLIHFLGDEKIYQREMMRLCQTMKEMNIPLELNILGVGEGKHYPCERFWKIAGEAGNQVILGLDAHSPDQVKDVESYQYCMDLVKRYQLMLCSDDLIK